MNFLCDTPYVECHVRHEFLYDQAKGQGEYTEATIFGFRAEPARVPMFQVMLASGAQWARIPIHALCIAPCEPLRAIYGLPEGLHPADRAGLHIGQPAIALPAQHGVTH